MDARINELLEFWFKSSQLDEMVNHRDEWWQKDEDFDQTIRGRFRPLYKLACSGNLDDWRDLPKGSLALVILLDQFSRNLFRDDPRAFAQDERARQLSKEALDKAYDQELPLAARVFLYMPLEHSEELPDQEQSVKLFKELGDPNYLDFAVRHYDIIARFGRFPHRNAVLGRKSTAEEEVFLQQPESSF